MEGGADVAINYGKSHEEAAEAKELVRRARESVRAAVCNEMFVQADVSQVEDVVSMFQGALDRWGRLDILINNAGIQLAAESDQLTAEDSDKVGAINLRGAYTEEFAHEYRKDRR